MQAQGNCPEKRKEQRHEVMLGRAVIFEPLDFMYRMYGMPRAHGCAGAAISRLVSLDCRDAGGRAGAVAEIPKPRVNL
jgi:hypothetical protein